MTQPFTRRLPLHPETDPCLPRYAVWEVTLRCDQACHFCGTRAGHARDNELTTDEALEIIRQLSELGTQEIALHGGEAYLRSDFFTIVRAIHDRGIHCTMVTGGRGMTPEVAREAKAAGIHAVSVSVDGTEATHDRLRGLQGSHAGAMRAMAALRDAGIKVGCNTQVNKQNYRELPALAELIHAYPIYGWQVQLMVPMGRAADAEDLWLQPYDMLEVIPIITDTRTLCDRIGIKLWPGDNVGYFGPCEHVLRKDRARGACP
jgi:MoaA/NifB/PqqE/SkfB family radical SAM enzyme